MNKEYWNTRVLELEGDKGNMVWSSRFRDGHLKWFNELISSFKNSPVLDVGCGYGRVSPLFMGEYHGIDFSEEMIRVAKKEYPTKSFEVADAYTYVPEKKYGVILVFHLSGLPEREKEIVEHYIRYCTEALIIVYGDRVTVINPGL